MNPVDITFASFGIAAPKNYSTKHYAMLWVLCLLFVIVGIAITVVLNFFSLFAGVVITFLGRNGTKFTFLRFFNKIPVVAIALPVLFGYAIWHQSAENGVFLTALPFFGIWALSGLLLLGVAFWQK